MLSDVFFYFKPSLSTEEMSTFLLSDIVINFQILLISGIVISLPVSLYFCLNRARPEESQPSPSSVLMTRYFNV